MAFAWFGWIIFHTRRDARMFAHRLSRVEQLQGVIVHLDEVLTMSAQMAATTGAPRWEERYHHFEPQLDAAIKETAELGDSPSSIEAASKTDAANLKLEEMETGAFALVRAGRKEEAQTVLFSREYETQKQIYLEGTTSLVDQIRHEFEENLRDEQRIDLVSVIAAMVVGGTSFVVWLSAARGVRRWRAELLDSFHRRAEAEESLRKAHAELEVRVSQRTAELADANQALQAENTGRKEAEAAAQRSQKRLRDLIDGLGPSMFVALLSPEGILLEINQSPLIAAGLKPEDVLGKPFDETPWWAHSQEVQRQLREAITRAAHGEASRYDVRTQGAGGRVIDIDFSLQPLRDETGEVVFLIPSASVITERKQVEEQLRASEGRYRSLFEDNPNPMWVFDSETLSFLAVNDAAVQHYGYSQEEFLTMTIKDIRPPEDIPALMDDLAGPNDVMNSSTRWRHLRKDGALLDVEITSHDLVWAGRPACVIMINDVTERKRAEETAQRLQKVEEERHLALEANRVKNEFLTTMSHELRTPLNAIIGFTGTMLMGLPGPITPAQKKQLETIKSSGRHQLSLINDLLDLAKIESGKVKLRLEPIACQEVVRAVAETLRPIAENKGLAFHVDLPVETRMAHAEERALKQILINLVNNAIKFTERGEVRIELRNGDKKTRIAVTDTGLGIKEEDRLKLFMAFSRLENTNTQREEGTGVGLHLSQKLAGLMGGEINLESEVGKGSTFTLVLEAESPLKDES